MLTTSEQSVLHIFEQFLVQSGEMLCFQGPLMKKHRVGLGRLANRGMILRERSAGGYSLTDSGFTAMRQLSGSKS